jgi:hypothetical protein
LYEGNVTLYLDINDQLNGAPNLLAFNKYEAGSYFGDSDIFCQQLRDSTAMCLSDVNALILSKDDLSYLIEKDNEIGKQMSLVAFEKANQHIKKMIHALIDNNLVKKFAKCLYPDLKAKRNTAAEYARNLMSNYFEVHKKHLTKSEKIVKRALNSEVDLLSSKKVFQEVLSSDLKEKAKIKNLKEARERAKYTETLEKMRK